MACLSIVSPVYNTGNMSEELVNRIFAAAAEITADVEIILVDDGSSDNSWNKISTLASASSFVKAIKLSRNFGQHAAIAAGLTHSVGDFVVVMDSDLQDPPELILGLYQEAQKGFEIVIARRQSRKHSMFRKLMSRVFFFLISRLSDLPADYAVANFGIYSRRIIDQVNAMKESHRFFPMMITWIGFSRSSIDYTHADRGEGVSQYHFNKLFKLAMHTTISYSDKPLRYVVKLGLVICIASFIYGIIILIRYLSGDILVLGYTSLILSIWFLGGIILFTLGIVGLYIGRTFEEVKQRPLYIVDKITG